MALWATLSVAAVIALLAIGGVLLYRANPADKLLITVTPKPAAPANPYLLKFTDGTSVDVLALHDRLPLGLSTTDNLGG